MRHLTAVIPLAGLAAASLVACQLDQPAPPGQALATTEQAAVYGDDDRTDYYAESSELWRSLTDGAIVAMMESSDVTTRSDGSVTINGDTFGPTYSLCRDERFYDQMNAADCSATLIDDDLVLTAGHCVTSNSACQRQRWVFRFYMESEDELASIVEEDVFGCSQIVVQELAETRTSRLDYAILQLDRPATPRFQPAPVARSVRMAEGDPVTIIGFGSGLPAKIDDGGRVTEPRTATLDYFEATTDSFGGNSGSGVFNARGEVVGILVNGQNDYTYRSGCARPQEYPETGSPYGAEGITYAERAIDELCGSGWPSARLCGTDAVCGDGLCSAGEEADCVDDCDSGIPGWTCDPAFFGAGDGCDCDCGAIDPDCADPTAVVVNCEVGDVCDATGACVPASEPPGPDPDPVPDAWRCGPDTYATGDACDCDCGAVDPDCANPDVAVRGCGDGESCSTSGECIDDPTDPSDPTDPTDPTDPSDPSDFDGILIDTDASTPAGCSAGAAGSGWFLLPSLAALLPRRRALRGARSTR